MGKVILTAARRDIMEINTYISRTLNNPRAASGIVKRITTQLRALEQQESLVAYRYLVCGNYMAFYHLSEEGACVDRILYGRRDYMTILFGDAFSEETE